MCRRMVCDCENPTVDLFCCPECDPRLSSQCLHQNGETLYNSGDTWVQDCRQCRCLVSSAAWGRSPGECEAQNLGGRQPCLPCALRSVPAGETLALPPRGLLGGRGARVGCTSGLKERKASPKDPRPTGLHLLRHNYEQKDGFHGKKRNIFF